MNNQKLSSILLALIILCTSIFAYSNHNHIMTLYDDKGKMSPKYSIQYIKITKDNNPKVYAWYENFKNKWPNKQDFKKFDICTIPGYNNWGTLSDLDTATSFEENYLVCPHTKTDFNLSDEIIARILTLDKNLEIFIDAPYQKFYLNEQNSCNKYDLSDLSNVRCFNDFLEWIKYLKNKYPSIDFDKIVWVIGQQSWAMNYRLPNNNKYYSIPKDSFVVYCPLSSIKNGLSSSDEGCLLHEIGHAKNHKKFPMLCTTQNIAHLCAVPLFKSLISCSAILAGYSATTYFDSKYQSIFKSIILASLIGKTTYLIAANIDERMADNFMCESADLPTLLATKKWFQDEADFYKELELCINNPLKLCLFKIIKFALLSAMDPHPDIQSRINKIENAILEKKVSI